MDPQKLAKLDPKLREAYDRVMGTSIPQPQNPSMQTPPPQPILNPNPIMQQQAPQTTNPNQMYSNIQASPPEAQTQIMVQKKGSIFTPILIGIGLLVGIAIYTFVWTKILGLELPFLSF